MKQKTLWKVEDRLRFINNLFNVFCPITLSKLTHYSIAYGRNYKALSPISLTLPLITLPYLNPPHPTLLISTHPKFTQTPPHLNPPHPHFTQPHLTLPYIYQPHPPSSSPHLTKPHLTKPHLTSIHLTLTSPLTPQT